MPSNIVSDVVTLGAGATINLHPPPGEAWAIYEFGSSVLIPGVPDISYGIIDGIHTRANIVIDPAVAIQKSARQKEIYLTNSNYLQITNNSAGAADVGWSGERVNANIVITDMVTVPNGGSVNIQPPDGETWRITEIGSELYGVANHPEVSIGITDGILVASMILREQDNRAQEKALDWIIDNALYLRLTNTAAADCDVAYCGVRVPYSSIGSVQNVPGAATLDIQPSATEEWVVTEFAAQRWSGFAPNGTPDISVSLYDAIDQALIMAAGIVTVCWNRRTLLHIHNSAYVRIQENSGVANEVGVLGYLKRTFS